MVTSIQGKELNRLCKPRQWTGIDEYSEHCMRNTVVGTFPDETYYSVIRSDSVGYSL
jgi:hypothetical protein